MTGTERTWRRQRRTSLDISASSDVALCLQQATKTGVEIAASHRISIKKHFRFICCFFGRYKAEDFMSAEPFGEVR